MLITVVLMNETDPKKIYNAICKKDLTPLDLWNSITTFESAIDVKKTDIVLLEILEKKTNTTKLKYGIVKEILPDNVDKNTLPFKVKPILAKIQYKPYK